jgi:hypothetical protein
MNVLLPLLLLLAPAQDDGLQKRVRAFVEQLQSDEIQAVDDAVAGLIALGTPALDAIRDELKKANGDAKLRLDEAVKKIERNVKRSRAVGPPVLVTIDAKEKPLSEVLEEIRMSTGQPIVFKDLPADKVTLSLDKTGFWEALDRLCKTHGGVMWEVKEKEIIVSKRPYRDLPKVFRGNQVVYFERLTSEHRHQAGRAMPSVSLEGGVAWTKGAFVPRQALLVDEFVDDQGTNLVVRDAGGGPTFTFNEEEAMDPEHLFRAIAFSQNATLHDKAAKLDRLKGSVQLEYVLESKRLALFEKPASLVGKPQKSGALTVMIKRFNKGDDDAEVRVHIESTSLREKLPIRASGFRLIDSKGALHHASGWVEEDVDEDAGKVEYDCDLEFALPEGLEIVALEFTIPTDLETVAIPFDFKGLPLK